MDVVIRRIRTRLLKQNKNFLCAICGATGSGKSLTAIRLACEIDPTFNVDRIVFTPEQFMDLLTSGEMKKGNVIVFDEAGVGIPAREWYSIQNKMLNYILQTFRYENLAVIFTTPTLDFIDANARKLFHAYIQTLAINFNTNKCMVKYYGVEYNPRFGKFYFKYPRARNGDNIEVLDVLNFSKPDAALIEKYETKKDIYVTKLKADTKASLAEMREKTEPKEHKETKKDIIFREIASGKRPIDVARETGISYNYITKLSSAAMALTTSSRKINSV